MCVKNHNQLPSGWSLERRDPEMIRALMPIWGWLYHHYFRVQTSGWEHIPPNQPVLLIGSHNGGLAAPDMFMMMYDWFCRFGVQRPAYGLMHPTVWRSIPPVAQLAERVGALVAHPKMAIAALQRGASVLVYPGGPEDVFRPHHLRHQIYFAERRGFIKLALRQKVAIVPVVSTGAHDTLLVLADFYPQVQQLHEWGMPWLFNIDPVVFPIYLGLPWGLALGPLPHIPLPVPIRTRICTPIWFERYGHEATRDRAYVNACYEKVRTSMQQELDLLTLQEAK
jgi:1-acyl-sn-glycerol-3-phosphate acyltransferase